MQKLKRKYLDAIKQDDVLKLKIAKAIGRAIKTIEDWRRANDPRLTMATVLNIIRGHLGLAETEVLTEPEELEGDKVVERTKVLAPVVPANTTKRVI